MQGNQSRRNRRFVRSIDGFSSRPAREWGGTINFKRPSSYQPGVQQSEKVADFNQSEGFHPASQDLIADSGQRTANSEDEDEGIVEQTAKPKKGFWRRFGRKNKHHSPAASHHKEKRSKKKIILRAGVALGALVVLTGAFLGIKAWIKANKVFQGGGGAVALNANPDPSLLKGEGDGRINILLLGKGGEGHTAPDLTDTILLVSIDPVNKEIALLSVPRDLYVKVAGQGTMKINAAYATAKQAVLAKSKKSAATDAAAEKAGLEAIDKTVSDTLGIPVHYHSMIDFEGFKKAIDTVGGVDFNVTQAVYEQMLINGKPYTLNVKTGQQHFDSTRALAYVRCRHCSARGDFDRNTRQRQVLVALKDKVLSVGTYANPIKISQLLDAFGDHIQSNMSIDEIIRLNEIVKGINSQNISSIGLADPPNNFLTTASVAGQSVVVPRDGIGNYAAIQSYVRNTLKDGYLKNENAGVLVLNGTTKSGLATTKAEELKSFGYRVVGTGDAPTKNYQQTVLVAVTDGSKKYTKRYLEQRLKTTAISKLPDGIDAKGADFVIIVGAN